MRKRLDATAATFVAQTVKIRIPVTVYSGALKTFLT
jgi:hypothetical protein